VPLRKATLDNGDWDLTKVAKAFDSLRVEGRQDYFAVNSQT
jgi:hypothetical protein